jgi:hypothetical protein
MSVVGLREIEPTVAALQNLPLLFRNWDEVDHVREKMRPAMEKRFLERGFVVVARDRDAVAAHNESIRAGTWTNGKPYQHH